MKTLTDTQQKAIDRLYDYNETLLIVPTGGGKTIITLTAIQELKELNRVLVVAPAKVVPGWAHEAAAWDLDLKVAGGTGLEEVKRIVKSDARVIVTSYDSLPLLLEMDHGCDGVVYDEITRLKASGGVSFRSMRKRLGGFWWRVGLSATPLSENFQALYGIVMMLDDGVRLGKRKDIFMDKYFITNPYQKYDIQLRVGADKKITEKVNDLVYLVAESEKRTTLPEPIIINDYLDDYPEYLQDIAGELCRESVTEVGDRVVLAVNRAVLSSKYRQLAQGIIYDENGEGVLLWKGRLDFLGNLIRGNCVVTYEFSLIGEELKKRYPKADFIDGKTPKKTFEAIKAKWRAGAGRLLFLQIQAGSHGLDGLQYSASQLINFAPIWSNDKSIQLIGRLDRTGQISTVFVQNIIARGTIDEVVTTRIEEKKDFFTRFLANLKRDTHDRFEREGAGTTG